MINRIIHQIWVGPLPAPIKWMNTWKEKNPNWQYILWDNKKVFSRKWHNQRIIDHYMNVYENNIRGKGPGGEDKFVKLKGQELLGDHATYYAWHILADILRYEILYEYGGYMPEADHICLRSVDNQFSDDIELYTVCTGAVLQDDRKKLLETYKKEGIDVDKLDHSDPRWKRLQRYQPYNATPILAAQKGNVFMKRLVDELAKLRPEDLGEAVDTTGNVFMGKMLRKYPPDNLWMPDYVYNKDLPDDAYSMNMYGTTKGAYGQGR